MIKKMTFVFAPFALALVLGACSDNEESTANEEAAAPETEQAEGTEEGTEEAAGSEEAAPAESALELPEEDAVVAVVNGEEIQGKVYNSVARQFESTLASQGQDPSTEENLQLIEDEAMSVVIGNAVLLQDAKDKGHEADDAVVEERMEELKANFEDEEAMNEALAETGFTLEEMEEQLREQLVYESYMEEEIDSPEVTDEEVQAAYDQFVESSEEEAPAFEEMEPTIRQSLQEQKDQEATFARVEELREEAEVEVKL